MAVMKMFVLKYECLVQKMWIIVGFMWLTILNIKKMNTNLPSASIGKSLKEQNYLLIFFPCRFSAANPCV